MNGDKANEYPTTAAYMLSERDTEFLLSMEPMTEELAREWLGESHRLGMDSEIVEHFAACVSKAKQRNL